MVPGEGAVSYERGTPVGVLGGFSRVGWWERAREALTEHRRFVGGWPVLLGDGDLAAAEGLGRGQSTRKLGGSWKKLKVNWA